VIELSAREKEGGGVGKKEKEEEQGVRSLMMIKMKDEMEEEGVIFGARLVLDSPPITTF